MRSHILATLIAVAAASPVAPDLVERTTPKAAAFCAVVTKLVTAASQEAVATAYCSSYLSIPLARTTTTVGEGVVTSTISSDTVTTTTTTISTCLLPSSTGSKRKRNSGSKAKPGCFSKYSSGPLITSACKCLSIPTSTTTITTQSAGGGSTVTVNQGTTSTSTSTVYARPAMASQQVYALAPGNSAVNGHYLFGPYFGEQGQDQANGEQYGFPSYRSCCASFTIEDDGSLVINGNHNGNTQETLYQVAGDPRVRSDAAVNLGATQIPLKCSYTGMPDGTCPMQCSGVNGNQNNADADLWRLNSVPGGFQLYALPP